MSIYRVTFWMELSYTLNIHLPTPVNNMRFEIIWDIKTFVILCAESGCARPMLTLCSDSKAILMYEQGACSGLLPLYFDSRSMPVVYGDFLSASRLWLSQWFRIPGWTCEHTKHLSRSGVMTDMTKMLNSNKQTFKLSTIVSKDCRKFCTWTTLHILKQLSEEQPYTMVGVISGCTGPRFSTTRVWDMVLRCAANKFQFCSRIFSYLI